VLVAHSGRQYAHRVALAVQSAGCLEQFVTSGYYRPDRFPDRLLSHWPGLDRLMRRRTFAGLDSGRVRRRWGLELPELLVRPTLGNGLLAERLVFLRDARFDRWVARRFASSCDIYWGFQGSCLESLRAARGEGKKAVAEFATAHVTLAVELLSAERDKHPEWADSISNLRFPDWYRRRLEQEPHEADVCVASSQFTKNSLLSVGIAEERIRLLPLGADLDEFTTVARSPEGPMRILFVGGVGQRKGIKYLLEAYCKMRTSGTELALVGPLMGSGKALRRYEGRYTYLGRLDSHEVVREMHRSHVLVLPSVFEGFAMVIPEAMATGMPVIASTHSIAPEVIRDGEHGFVLEPDDVDGLAARLDWLAMHRREACDMGARAAVQARSLSWDCHRAKVAELIEDIAQGRQSGTRCSSE